MYSSSLDIFGGRAFVPRPPKKERKKNEKKAIGEVELSAPVCVEESPQIRRMRSSNLIVQPDCVHVVVGGPSKLASWSVTTVDFSHFSFGLSVGSRVGISSATRRKRRAFCFGR